MTIVNIGLPTRALRQPLRRALATAAELGADGVEIDLRTELPLAELSQSAVRQFRKLLDDYNLRLAAVSYPTRRGYEDSSELDRRLAGTRQAMNAAAQLGAKVVINRAYGQLPEPGSSERDTLLGGLESLAREGTRVGAQLAALTTAQPASELADLLAELPEGTVGVALHPANLLGGGQTPIDALEVLGPLILYAYANDAVRDFGASRTLEVELGRGTADMPAALAALDARDYLGWITATGSDSTDAVTELGNAVAYLRNLALG